MLLARGRVSAAKDAGYEDILVVPHYGFTSIFEETTLEGPGIAVGDGKGGGQEHLSCCHRPSSNARHGWYRWDWSDVYVTEHAGAHFSAYFVLRAFRLSNKKNEFILPFTTLAGHQSYST